MRRFDEGTHEVVHDAGDLWVVGIVLNRFNDGGTDDDAVRFFGHFARLIGGGDTETDADWGIGVFFDGGDKGPDGFGGRTVGTGDPSARKSVDEALGTLREFFLAMLWGGRGDEADVMKLFAVSEFRMVRRFVGGEIEKENAVHTSRRCVAMQFFITVGVNRVEVGEKDDRSLVRLAESFDDSENFGESGARFESAVGRHLVHDAIGHGIGKGDTKFDDVGSRVGDAADDFQAFFGSRVACCHVGHKGFFVFRC